MLKLKGIILSAALSLLTMQSFAQTPLESLRSMFSSGAVSIMTDYEMTFQQMPVTGKSELLVQGGMYYMKGNGLEVFCNGDVLWTIDESSHEVVIESCEDLAEAYMGNPVLLLTNLDTCFEIKSQRRIGNNTEYILDAVRDCGVAGSQILLASDGTVLNGKFFLEDGNVISVQVTSMKKTEQRAASSFSPGRKFNSEWIVTDLR